MIEKKEKGVEDDRRKKLRKQEQNLTYKIKKKKKNMSIRTVIFRRENGSNCLP